MNISDSERVSAVLESMKYKRIPSISDADLIAVTMCSVKQSAVDRIHGLAQKLEVLKKTNPKLRTILTGCVLKKDKRFFVEDFDYVIDIKDIKKIPKLLLYKMSDRSLYMQDNYLDIAPKYSSNFSACIPIMTGCNNFCAYCVVPYARDREVSRPAEKIISEIKNFIESGGKEIWLLGQNVNSYKDGKTDFPKLLKMVNNISGDFWIRFTSSHPKDFSDKLINAMTKCNKVTPYLNLPIQSGDDKILKSMNRRYKVAEYKNKIKKLREKIPAISLSTDIIIGFPGETRKQFENTIKLFRTVKYDMAYINKYSTRSGTAAAKLNDNVSIQEKKEREVALNKILKKTALENNKKYIGKIVQVLIDRKKENSWLGRTASYKEVATSSSKNLLGKFILVKITSVTPWHLKADPYEE